MACIRAVFSRHLQRSLVRNLTCSSSLGGQTRHLHWPAISGRAGCAPVGGKWKEWGLLWRQPVAFMSNDKPNKPKKNIRTVKVTFIDRDGDEITVDAKIGDTLLEVAKEYDVDLEGACEGTLSCSTCHLIVDKDWYPKIPDLLTEEEMDMLDLAFGLTDTSRLGCQIVVSDAIDGIRLTVPAGTSDARNL